MDDSGTPKTTEKERYKRSAATFQRARQVLPGGITRTTVASSPHPIYIDSGKGPWLIDIDGNRYLDLNNNFTTLIHGHAFPAVINALNQRLPGGTCYANPTIEEIALAEILCARIPAADRIRFVNTGSEAILFSIKAARACTGRRKIAKFEGAYHGNYDWAEIGEDSSPNKWGDLSHPASVAVCKGVSPSVIDETLILPVNAYDETLAILEQHAKELACVLIDVMPSRAGLIPLDAAYLKMLREFTQANNILLISDEVLNFRQAYAGASARFNLDPDLITLGKIIGGGLPIGAIAGREELMAVFDNTHGPPPLPQGGTFSANPLSMQAGMASMKALDSTAFEHLEALGEYARKEISATIANNDLPFSVTGQTSLFRIHPKIKAPRSYREAYQNSEEQGLMARLCRFLTSEGVLFNGLGSISTVMTRSEIDFFVSAFSLFADNLKASSD